MNIDSLALNEALIHFLYQAPVGLMQTTLDGDITLINPMSAQLLMPLVPDGNLLNLFDALQSVVPQLRAQVAASQVASGVICEALRFTVAAPGTPANAAHTLSLSLMKLDATTLMASLTNVSTTVLREEQRLATQLDKAARTDSLTAMPNRAVVQETLARAIARARAGDEAQVALLFLNCDRFKRINDSYGRHLADELLRLMADRLNGALRPRDALSREPTAARLGSDEFVVVLEDLRRADDAQAVALRLLDVLGKPYAIGAHQVRATVSIGVLQEAHAGDDADAMLQNASIAMHEAKRAGGARYSVYEPAMGERASRRGGIESELRRAIHEAQLFVVYQPLVAFTETASPGVEALVRWRHPLRGVVPPIEFIEIAEESGLICALGAFVLNEACRQFMRWRETLGEHAPAMISVNLSRAQLAEAELVQEVREALRQSGMPPGCLQLEVTESLAAQDEHVQGRLHELKALGLSLALDDFGTGYSSLSSLHLLPVDVVKIDRSFVSQAESSEHHRVLIEATVRVARSLGMDTVAEGVETEGQARVLRRLDCDKGQGYLFSRPMAADEATRWLADRALYALATIAAPLDELPMPASALLQGAAR